MKVDDIIEIYLIADKLAYDKSEIIKAKIKNTSENLKSIDVELLDIKFCSLSFNETKVKLIMEQ